MKAQFLVLVLVGLTLGCRHGDWLHQDSTVRMPGYESIMAAAPIDGPTLRALQVATHDFFPSWGPLRACIDTPEAHKYYAVRRAEVVYVAIVQDPSACGRAYASLDSGVRYAISIEGRILGRLLDGEPEAGAIPEDTANGAESVVQEEVTAEIDVTVPPGVPVHFPVSPDGGAPSSDGGTP